MKTGFYLVAGFLGFWGITTATSVLLVILIVPFAVNEMVLAVWLIVKGFNSAATASPFQHKKPIILRLKSE